MTCNNASLYTYCATMQYAQANCTTAELLTCMRTAIHLQCLRRVHYAFAPSQTTLKSTKLPSVSTIQSDSEYGLAKPPTEVVCSWL